MLFIKKLIARLAGSRPTITELDPKKLSSVLIKPFGYKLGEAVVHSAHLNQLKKSQSPYSNRYVGNPQKSTDR